MEFFRKIESNPHQDLLWNIPEQPMGAMNVIGGNAQSFRTPVKVAETLGAKYPIKEVRLVLPDALQGKLPPLPGVIYLKSTESGSFADGDELGATLAAADFNLVVGDVSKNSITGKALAGAYDTATKPVLVTRDAIDLLAEHCTEATLMNPNLILMGSLAQLIKVMRAVYYPKMMTLSQSLVQLAEALHKFTLSYPVKIVTLHSGQVVVAADGAVVAMPLEQTGFTPLSLWMGEGAARVAALNLYNPGKFTEATVAGLAK